MKITPDLVPLFLGIYTAHYEYDPYGNEVRAVGPVAGENEYRFSTKYYDSEVKLYYYGYRYYSAELGRWINRDPIGEKGGANIYLAVHNNPISFFDILGLIFDITYVRFDTLQGHAWIRTGEMVDVTINAEPGSAIEVAGKMHRLLRLHAKLPEGYGFYPAEDFKRSNPIELFGPRKGIWIPEHDPRYGGKEFMVASNKIKLLSWETELKKQEYQYEGDLSESQGKFAPATFKYGDAKGKCCSSATKNQVTSCLGGYIRENTPQQYQFPFLQCRARAKDALNACCLRTGEKSGNIISGDIRAEYDPNPLPDPADIIPDDIPMI